MFFQKVSNRLFFILFCFSLFISAHAQSPEIDSVSPPIGQREIGQELKGIEEDIVKPRVSIKPDEDGEAKKAIQKTLEGATEEDKAAGSEEESVTPAGRRILFRGDVDLLAELNLLQPLRTALSDPDLANNDIRAIVKDASQVLIDQGYYLASIWSPPGESTEEELLIEVDAGRIGDFAFFDADQDMTELGDDERAAYSEKYFSVKQLSLKLERNNVVAGRIFNYNDFYGAISEINTHPDITVHTDLRVNKELTDQGLDRFIDMEFSVEEKIPFHAVLDLDNSGTDVTDDWRAGLTLQHLNLTKHDDVLTLSFPVSLDLKTIRSVASSYYLPHHLGRGGAFTLYGGYSSLDAEDVVESIDIEGEGWFGGFQGSYKLLRTSKHQLDISGGLVYRYIEDQLIVADFETEPREIKIAPLSLALSYASVQPDALGGRNFLTSQTAYNFGGVLGTSEDEDFEAQRSSAEASYGIQRIQLARIQPILGSLDEQQEKTAQWVVFLKSDIQIATGSLIPAEQKSAGGYSTVRGYIEREFLGDHGITGSIELRTPLLLNFVSSKIMSDLSVTDIPIDRLQFVVFMDGGYVSLDDTLPGEEKSQSLYSAGAGFRVAATQHIQFRFDWGFPLKETEESDSGGRGSVNLQIQF